jgi:hypothetical protein
MGLGDWFSTFCSNIQVQDGGTISTRYKAITRRLNTDFWTTTSDTAHSLYAGSYGRNTAIKGFSDLDMIFQLPNSLYERMNNTIPMPEMGSPHSFRPSKGPLRRPTQQQVSGPMAK